MKIYCRSFWRAYLVISIFIPTFLLQLVIAPRAISKVGFSYLGFAIVFVANFFVFSLVIFSEFYVILFDDALGVKNGICPFWKKKVCYKDIVKINIVYLGGYSVPYMQIITSKTRFTWRYYLDRVKRKNILEIIASLRENNVEVDVVGMDLLT